MNKYINRISCSFQVNQKRLHMEGIKRFEIVKRNRFLSLFFKRRDIPYFVRIRIISHLDVFDFKSNFEGLMYEIFKTSQQIRAVNDFNYITKTLINVENAPIFTYPVHPLHRTYLGVCHVSEFYNQIWRELGEEWLFPLVANVSGEEVPMQYYIQLLYHGLFMSNVLGPDGCIRYVYRCGKKCRMCYSEQDEYEEEDATHIIQLTNFVSQRHKISREWHYPLYFMGMVCGQCARQVDKYYRGIMGPVEEILLLDNMCPFQELERIIGHHE